MVEWAVHNAEFLSHHHIVCTGTTGNLVRKALEEKGVNADIACMHSGPMGGDAEVAAMVVRKEIDLSCATSAIVNFFIPFTFLIINPLSCSASSMSP